VTPLTARDVSSENEGKMKKVILLGCMLSFFGFATSAYAGFSMNAVADENVAIDAQKYAKFETTLNKFEPKKIIWVHKEARLTEEDIDSAYAGSIETVEDPWAVPLKVLDRQPTVIIKFKSTSRKKLENFTAENIQKTVAIIVDGEILAAPKGYEPITDGITQINGNWTEEEVTQIVDRINKIAKAKNKS
jgi:preprotein translocase subunit SecD